MYTCTSICTISWNDPVMPQKSVDLQTDLKRRCFSLTLYTDLHNRTQHITNELLTYAHQTITCNIQVDIYIYHNDDALKTTLYNSCRNHS